MGKRKHLDDHQKVEAILFAEMHGDPAACERFKIAPRTLHSYRALARQDGSEIAKICTAYRAALATDDAKAEDFAAWLLQQVREAGGLLVEKARQADARNPEALRVLNEHVATLLDHQTATTYIDRLFAPTDDPEGDPEGDPEAEAD
ncbi:MAG: hypothetical protein IAE99_07930 [Rhodothermales bacterium]|nr:hypothetical protein [Rhodothermales bacterium]